jgi:hypothetical protein
MMLVFLQGTYAAELDQKLRMHVLGDETLVKSMVQQPIIFEARIDGSTKKLKLYILEKRMGKNPEVGITDTPQFDRWIMPLD